MSAQEKTWPKVSQEDARALLAAASKTMMEAEYAEAEALARLNMVTPGHSTQEVDALLAEANAAFAARVGAQLHYANCKLLLRHAWDTRGEES